MPKYFATMKEGREHYERELADKPDNSRMRRIFEELTNGRAIRNDDEIALLEWIEMTSMENARKLLAEKD
jgi:hypothetical protein